MISPDWDTHEPDEFMSNEGQRLTWVEKDVELLKANDHDKEVRIRDIEKTIWKAFGATSLLQVAIVIVVEVFKR